MFNFLKSSTTLGVDIGSTAIKIAEVKPSSKGGELLHFGSAPLIEESFLGDDKKRHQFIGKTISEIVSSLGSRSKNVCVGGFGSSVIARKLVLPKMDKKMLLESCYYEAENYIHYDLEDVHLNFIPLDGLNARDDKKMHVLVVATLRETVLDVSGMIFDTGLHLSVLDVEGFALANCFELNYGVLDTQTVLVNVGSSITNFVVVDRGEVVFCQDIPVGGARYTKEISSALKVSSEEAESMKVSYSRDGSAPDQLKKIVEKVNALVVEEIQGNLNFFQSKNEGHISQCFVTGGAASVPGFLEDISKTIPSQKMDPFLKVKTSKWITAQKKEEIRDICAVSIGLSLRNEE